MPLSSQVLCYGDIRSIPKSSASNCCWGSKFLRRRPRARSAILEMCNFEKGSEADLYLSVRSILINSIGSGKMMVEFCSAAISVSVCR
jgi:hypothetical protein